MAFTRRNFLGLTSSATTALLLSSLETFSSYHKSIFPMDKNFELKIMATNWGFPGSIDAYCALAKKEGYDGIEIWWPLDKKSQDELFNALQKNKLDVGFLVGGQESNYAAHFATFTKMIDGAATNTSQRPLYINCHSGKDYFSFEENKTFIDYTIKVHAETGIVVCNETHRSRILYSAPVAKQYIEKIPGLRVTLDISHWCNVHESLLQDQQQTVDLVLSRVDHIHARIGHQESPQVSDPRAPEWDEAVKAHFAWWDKIVEEKKKNGQRVTILTEFGPPHYMPALPYTLQPVADQWAINVYMMQVLRKRYGI
jgi:hypothetical protein